MYQFRKNNDDRDCTTKQNWIWQLKNKQCPLMDKQCNSSTVVGYQTCPEFLNWKDYTTFGLVHTDIIILACVDAEHRHFYSSKHAIHFGLQSKLNYKNKQWRIINKMFGFSPLISAITTTFYNIIYIYALWQVLHCLQAYRQYGFLLDV